MKMKRKIFLLLFSAFLFHGISSRDSSSLSDSSYIRGKLGKDKKVPSSDLSQESYLKETNVPPIPKPDYTSLFSKTENVFDVKHLFPKDENGNVMDSFKELSKDSNFAKRYLTDLNLEVYNGQILPYKRSASNFQLKLNNMINIVDADIEHLRQDIQKSFNEWKANPEGKPIFLTKEAYTVTHLTYELDPNDPNVVVVKGEQRRTKVILGVDEFGNPVHLEPLSKVQEPGQVLQKSRPIARFSMEELKTIVKSHFRLWRRMSLPLKGESGVLDKTEKFNSLKEAAEKEIKMEMESHSGSERPKSGRSIVISPDDGQVKSIDPKEFPGEYKEADEARRREMAELVKKNGDKVFAGAEEGDKKKMWNLVQLEELKSHKESLDTVTEIENFAHGGGGTDEMEGGGKSSSKFKDYLHGWHEKLRGIDVKISTSKFAQSMNALANTKGAHGFSRASSALSIFFLSKSFINGVVNQDTTSVAIICARVGYEAATYVPGVKYAKWLTEAAEVGKWTKAIGKWAGPVGGVADIGLGIWSLTKSAQRLHNSTNRYDRNDAIVDVVSDTINVINTALVTGLSLAFPLAAPVFVAVGLVVDLFTRFEASIFKAGNEVDRIDSEIPLLDSEKSEVYRSRFLDWFGTRKPDYFDSMMDEKKANDLIVQDQLKFLEENDNFLGVVFPARSVYVDGGCCRTKRYCKLKNAWGCTTWKEDRWTVACGCDFRKPCGSGRWAGICDNYITGIGAWGYDDWECKCTGSRTNIGEPRKNSKVDFQTKQSLYWERTVPSEVEGRGTFICKPGSLKFVDFHVSQREPRNDFLCENAIALKQPQNRIKAQPTQILLFDLEDGYDRVYLGNGNQRNPNLFRMGKDGYKEFFGANADDKFLFDSDCTSSLQGSFFGGSGYNSIIIGDNCTKGGEVSVDFQRGKLRNTGRTLLFDFMDIEEFNGREGEEDLVWAECSTRKVVGRGGAPTRLDKVIIGGNQTCMYNLTIVGDAYTEIIFNATGTANGSSIMIPVASPWTGLKMEFEVHPKEKLNQNVIFLETSSSHVKNWSLEMVDTNQLDLKLEAVNGFGNFRFKMGKEKELSIFFTEQPQNSPYSVLFLSIENNITSAMFYHTLNNVGPGNWTRAGCKLMENMFDVTGQGWNIIGGDLGDEFVLNTTYVGKINGGDGLDTIKFHQDFNTSFLIDLGSSQFESVEQIYGVGGTPLKVKTACDTILVATQGGLKANPDVVTVPGNWCKNRTTKIVATGHTRLVMEAGKERNVTAENDMVQVVVKADNINGQLGFELKTEMEPVSNLLVAIILSHKNWTVTKAKMNAVQQAISVSLKGPHENTSGDDRQMKFNLKVEDMESHERFLEWPYMEVSIENSSEVSGLLQFDRVSGYPKMVYNLNGSSPDILSTGLSVTGFIGIENEFRLTTSDKQLNATGGNLDDAFFINAGEEESGSYVIDGSGGDGNTLIIGIAENATLAHPYLVNLVNNELGLSNISSERRGRVENIQHVIGRPSAPDAIHASCVTKSVNGRSGHGPGKEQDVLLISQMQCKYNLMTVLGKFATLRNTAPNGDFTYLVEDLLSSSLELNKVTKSSTHSIKLTFHAWDFITAVAFNESTEILGWKLSDGLQEQIQIFPMWKPSESEDYSNPVFEFHPPGSSVMSDIRVTSNGVTTATFAVIGNSNPEIIKGIPVDLNMFQIDITEKSTQPKGEIHGCSDGVRCSANQFWIQNLASPLKLLDGGACQEDGCSNYLHFSKKLIRKSLHVDLDVNHGYVKTEDGKDVISQLKNIHELQGTRDITAYATCNTTHVSGVDQLILKAESCPLDLVIGLEPFTKVYFQKRATGQLKDNQSFDNDTSNPFLGSEIYYRFSEPMSFDPDGDVAAMISHSHLYSLSFKMESLKEMRFVRDEDKLYYTLSGTEYFYHSMITSAGFTEQFYAQPIMTTEDGYRIQVGRDGSIMATLGNTSKLVEVTPDSVPELQRTANLLGITLMIHGPNHFYYVGHSSPGRDRNALENAVGVISHLAGGGADNTIYEILHLDKDVFIYPGFSEDALDTWKASGENATKQTIDLTDVIVPIRQKTGEKYVPSIKSDGDNIVISMDGHEDFNPGKVVIVNGSYPWVAQRLQILLNVAMMDLINIKAAPNRRNKRSTEYQWKLKPRPIKIPEATQIYSISPDDLEEGHVIQVHENLNNNESGSDSLAFQAARNGGDLLITNVHNLDGMNGGSTVKIGGFYPSHGSTGDDILGVTLKAPGLHLILNKTKLFNVTGGDGDVNIKPAKVSDWTTSLYQMEETLLKDMPDIPRTFKPEECQSEWETWLIVGGICILVGSVIGFITLMIMRRRRGDLNEGLIFGGIFQRLRDTVREADCFKRRNYERL